MINQYFHIARLIIKYLSEEIKEEELAELTQWRNESAENERLFQEICREENIKRNMQKRQAFSAEDGWIGVQRKIQHHRFRYRLLNVCKYAAILILPLAIATAVLYKSTNEHEAISHVTEQILPGSKKAVLILDNGETIDLKSTSGVELKEKWQRTISSFTQNFDQDDPEFISLREAFMERFKEHGFVIDTIAKFNEETQALDEIIGRLQDLQKRNNVLLKKYKGDEKFARVHKRIREVNKQREDKRQKPMFSFLDEEIAAILNIIKEDVDAKVYDRNDILKKDAYFGRTVMALINGCLFHFPQIKPEMEDYKFIQTRISQQYINQYNATYGIA